MVTGALVETGALVGGLVVIITTLSVGLTSCFGGK